MHVTLEPTTMRPYREIVVEPQFACGHCGRMRLMMIGIDPGLVGAVEKALSEVKCFGCAGIPRHLDVPMNVRTAREQTALIEKMASRALSYTMDITWYRKQLAAFNAPIDRERVTELLMDRLHRLAEVIHVAEALDRTH